MVLTGPQPVWRPNLAREVAGPVARCDVCIPPLVTAHDGAAATGELGPRRSGADGHSTRGTQGRRRAHRAEWKLTAEGWRGFRSGVAAFFGARRRPGATLEVPYSSIRKGGR
jgi:hypothetical protein